MYWGITLMGGLPRIEASMYHHVRDYEHFHKDECTVPLEGGRS